MWKGDADAEEGWVGRGNSGGENGKGHWKILDKPVVLLLVGRDQVQFQGELQSPKEECCREAGVAVGS